MKIHAHTEYFRDAKYASKSERPKCNEPCNYDVYADWSTLMTIMKQRFKSGTMKPLVHWLFIIWKFTPVQDWKWYDYQFWWHMAPMIRCALDLRATVFPLLLYCVYMYHTSIVSGTSESSQTYIQMVYLFSSPCLFQFSNLIDPVC